MVYIQYTLSEKDDWMTRRRMSKKTAAMFAAVSLASHWPATEACGDHVVKVKSFQASIHGKKLKEESTEKVVNKYLNGEGGGGHINPPPVILFYSWLQLKETGSRDGIQIFGQKWILLGIKRNLYWFLNFQNAPLVRCCHCHFHVVKV